jgi:DNA-binding beta-propeller fold protein YncE
MTTPDANSDLTSGETVPAEAAASPEGTAPAAADTLVTTAAPVTADAFAAADALARKKRRRKLMLLAILTALVSIAAILGGAYILLRKPIPEILPGIAQDKLPQYSFSIYGLVKPMGIAVSPSGDRIYVTETGGERTVHIFDGKGQQLAAIAPPKSTVAGRVPVYVALDPLTGDVYVSDRISAAIYIYDRDGAYRRTFAPNPAIPGWQPLGLAFDAQGSLYVGDLGGGPFHRVLVFDRAGALKRTIGEAGQFNFPNGLAVDDKGDLFVADANDGRVMVIDGTGRQIGNIPRGVGTGELGLPRGVALDDQHRLYVVDTTGQGLLVYRTDQVGDGPKYIGTAGVEGTADGQFEYPFGVAADTRGRIYVADWANDRVQVWSY